MKLILLALTVALLAVATFAQPSDGDKDRGRPGGDDGPRPPSPGGRGDKPNSDDDRNNKDGSNNGSDDNSDRGRDRDDNRNGNDRDREGNGDKDKNDKPDKNGGDRSAGSSLNLVPFSGITVAKPDTFNEVIIQGQITVSQPTTVSVSGYPGSTGSLNDDRTRPGEVAQQQSRFDILSRDSLVTVYVSTKQTIDRQNAFAHYDLNDIDRGQSHTFPLNFNITVDLPVELRGRSDFTLYLFVYIRNERHDGLDIFTPGGISNVVLMGTNRLVQKLQLLVRPAGVLVQGTIIARYQSMEIPSDTAFRIVIVDEDRSRRPIADLQINKPGTRYPVPISLLVPYQLMRPNTNYYAYAFILVNGDSRPISTKPLWVITQNQELVQQQIQFVVLPLHFNIKVRIVRTDLGGTRGNELQDGSYLVLNLIRTDTRDMNITYSVGKIQALPATFDVTLSMDKDFDGSKQYYVQAIIFTSNNRPYIITNEPVLLPEQPVVLMDLRVEDLVYFVQCLVQPSQLTVLNFLPNSIVQYFVTDNPETPKDPISYGRFNITHTLTEINVDLEVSRIQKQRNYYLVVFVFVGGPVRIITQLTKVLIISDNNPPSSVIQIPLISLNIISGIITDVHNRPAAWTTPSKAVCYLMDSTAYKQGDKGAVSSIVQTWDVNLNNDFPIRFSFQLDFSRLIFGHTYDMQCLIKDQAGLIEYNWGGSAEVFNPSGFKYNVELQVYNVRTNYTANGLIYIQDMPKVDVSIDAQIIIRLCTSPDIHNPTVIKEITIAAGGKDTPIRFSMTVPLSQVNIRTYYYFLVEYVVGDHIIFPSIQAFAFTWGSSADVVITISQSQLVGINGQVTAPNGNLVLPETCKLHIWIMESANTTTSTNHGVISEVFLPSKPDQNYLFTLNLQKVLIEQQRPLYLNAAVICGNTVIMQMPTPSALRLDIGGKWNINIVISMPTLFIGQLTTLSGTDFSGGNVDVYLYVIVKGQPLTVLQTYHIQITTLPSSFIIQGGSDLFNDKRELEIMAVIKNCKEQILYKSGGTVGIRIGFNVNLVIPLIQVDANIDGKPSDLTPPVYANGTGEFILSATGLVESNKK